MPHTKSLEELSASTGIPISRLNEALEAGGKVRCRATTVEEAQNMFNGVLEHSDAERAILRRWISLCATVEEAQSAYNVIPEDSDEEQAVLVKIIELHRGRE